jgi:cold shock CspA family protein
MATGTIELNTDRSYCFSRPDEGAEDVFFQHASLVDMVLSP